MQAVDVRRSKATPSEAADTVAPRKCSTNPLVQEESSVSALELAREVAQHVKEASVKDLTACLAEWPSELRQRLQALLPPAPSLDRVEYRAITLEQMNTLFREEVEGRADADGFLPEWYETRYSNRDDGTWRERKLCHKDSINLYDLMHWCIKPLCAEKKCSYHSFIVKLVFCLFFNNANSWRRKSPLEFGQFAVVRRWGSSQRLEVLVEMDYDRALDVLAKHYSGGRVHCQLAERKVEA